jgi:hypothetical protein
MIDDLSVATRSQSVFLCDREFKPLMFQKRMLSEIIDSVDDPND